MPRRLVALALLGAFASMAALPALAAGADDADQRPASLFHEDGAPCPDGDEEGPCDRNCPCLCCPGHATVLFPVVDGCPAPDLSSTRRQRPRKAAHPDGVFCRIFRPPRS
jgi:hypothetical protein